MNCIEELKGKTLTSVKNGGGYYLIFRCTDGSAYKMYHEQDCCESVSIEDINGDFEDIFNEEILQVYEKINTSRKEEISMTYTFYTIRTFNASVDIRWYGESDGYYSKAVDFIRIK